MEEGVPRPSLVCAATAEDQTCLASVVVDGRQSEAGDGSVVDERQSEAGDGFAKHKSPRGGRYGPCANLSGRGGCVWALARGGQVDVEEGEKLFSERERVRRKLVQAICLCTFFMAIEIVGGILSSSLAILTDAAHLLSDIAGFAISLFALSVADWQATPRHSFGYHRMEILGALLSIQLIWIITVLIVYEAIVRLTYKNHEVNGKIMFLTATFGVVVNVAMSFLLGHEHGHLHIGQSECHKRGSHSKHHHLHHGHSHHGHHSHHSDHGHHSHHSHHKHYVHHSHLSPRAFSSDWEGGKGHSALNSPAKEAKHSGTLCSGSSTGFEAPHFNCGVPLFNNASQRVVEAQRSSESQSGTPLVPYPFQTTERVHLLGQAAAVKQQQPHRGPLSGESIILRGAYLHVLGDLIQSIGVVIAGAIIWWKPHWKIVDLVCTLLFSGLVLYTTARIMADITGVLMDSTPPDINAEEVALQLKSLPDVNDVHELHVWAVTVGKTMLACHVTIGCDADSDQVLQQVVAFCKQEYDIEHVTCQVERSESLTFKTLLQEE